MNIATNRLTIPKRTLFFAGLLLVLGSTLFVGGLQHKTSAADCDDNAIIKCGFSSASDFIKTVKNNSSGNGHSDLKAVYDHYGLQPADYDRFVASAKSGTAYKDGRIVVDGQTVATNAASIGRLSSYQGSGYFTTPAIDGHVYYGNVDQRNFVGNSIPVMVMFDSKGNVEFAVLTSCGNPIYGTNTPSSYSCNTIHKSAVSGKANTYSFTASASDSGNAHITKYTYDFGDGSSTVTTTSGSTAIQHTYSKPGTFTASVTITVTLPGNSSGVTATSLPCKTTIVVARPSFSCVQLSGAIIDKSKFSYSFVATAQAANGATFSSADFDFGDKNVTRDVAAKDLTATTTHMYAQGGKYTITATLHFSVNGTNNSNTSVTCIASVTPTTPPTPECRPNVPVGSPMCTPCQYNSSIPASDTEHCVVPASVTTTLPNTGAGTVIGIFGAAVVAGFFIFRQFIYKRHQVISSAAAMNLEHDFYTAQHNDPNAAAGEHPAARAHANPLTHPTYHKPRRFRPRG